MGRANRKPFRFSPKLQGEHASLTANFDLLEAFSWVLVGSGALFEVHEAYWH